MLTWRAVAVQSRSSSGIYVPELWGPAIFAFLVLPSLYDCSENPGLREKYFVRLLKLV